MFRKLEESDPLSRYEDILNTFLKVDDSIFEHYQHIADMISTARLNESSTAEELEDIVRLLKSTVRSELLHTIRSDFLTAKDKKNRVEFILTQSKNYPDIYHFFNEPDNKAVILAELLKLNDADLIELFFKVFDEVQLRQAFGGLYIQTYAEEVQADFTKPLTLFDYFKGLQSQKNQESFEKETDRNREISFSDTSKITIIMYDKYINELLKSPYRQKQENIKVAIDTLKALSESRDIIDADEERLGVIILNIRNKILEQIITDFHPNTFNYFTDRFGFNAHDFDQCIRVFEILLKADDYPNNIKNSVDNFIFITNIILEDKESYEPGVAYLRFKVSEAENAKLVGRWEHLQTKENEFRIKEADAVDHDLISTFDYIKQGLINLTNDAESKKSRSKRENIFSSQLNHALEILADDSVKTDDKIIDILLILTNLYNRFQQKLSFFGKNTENLEQKKIYSILVKITSDLEKNIGGIELLEKNPKGNLELTKNGLGALRDIFSKVTFPSKSD